MIKKDVLKGILTEEEAKELLWEIFMDNENRELDEYEKECIDKMIKMYDKNI